MINFTILQDVQSVHWFMLHNVPGLSSFFSDDVIVQDLGDMCLLPFSFCRRLSFSVSASLGLWSKLQLPLGHQDQRSWVLDALRHSAKGLSKPGVAIFGAESVLGLVATKRPGGAKSSILKVC